MISQTLWNVFKSAAAAGSALFFASGCSCGIVLLAKGALSPATGLYANASLVQIAFQWLMFLAATLVVGGYIVFFLYLFSESLKWLREDWRQHQAGRLQVRT